jgi:DNA integrity scanning protein DisA with diadenylate cyclase activity
MSKYKDYIYDNAEKEVDSISDDYAKSKIDLDSAVDKIKKVDNYEMIVDEYNIEDALYYAKNDYEQKTLSKYY